MYQFPHYPDQVPDDLKSGRQWVGCDAEKVPYIVGTRRMASSTDPDTWRTYDEALAAYEKGKHVGIGRVFAKEDPFVGVDFDHVLNDEGIQPESLELLRLLDSYSEVSPSGRGFKVFLRAELGRSHKKVGLEIYPHGRYFTVTGQILTQASASVEARTAELQDLIRRGFPDPTRRSEPSEYDGPEIELADYLANPELEVLGPLPDGLGVKYAIVCPWVHEHTDGKHTGTRLGQRDGGGPWFHCDHAHCAGRGWQEFKRVIRPVRRICIVRRSNPNPIKRVRLSRG